MGAAALCDRIVPMATALARVLPTTPPVSGSLRGTPDPRAQRGGDSRAPGRCSPPTTLGPGARRRLQGPLRREWPSGRRASPDGRGGASRAARRAAAEPAEAARAAAAAELPSVLNTIFRIPPGVIEPAIAVADTGTSVSPRLDLADCQVDAVIAESYSGAALIMADLAEDTIFSTPIVLGPPVASAVVHGSRMRCRFPLGETALGFALAEASVTGNIIANEVAVPAQPSQTLPDSYSLSLFRWPRRSARLPWSSAAISSSTRRSLRLHSRPGSRSTPSSATAWCPPSPRIISGTAPPQAEQTVTITGTGFTAATSVSFGSAAPRVDHPFRYPAHHRHQPVTATGGSPVDVTVTTPPGTSATSAADRFTYIQPVVITAAAQPRQPGAQSLRPAHRSHARPGHQARAGCHVS